MSNSLSEAFESLTQPGAPYATTTALINGHEQTVFESPPQTLHDIFYSAVLGHADKDFLVYQGERWTFKEGYEEAARLALQLQQQFNVEVGDRVAIAMRNYPELVLTLMAASSIGAVPVPMNAWWTGPELEYALNDCSAKVLVADVERLERLETVIDQVKLETIAVRTDSTQFTRCHSYSQLIESAPSSTMPVADIDADSNGLILYTSGTTGHPKGALSTHRAVISALLNFECNVLANVIANAKNSLPADESKEKPAAQKEYQAAVLVPIPLFHVTGLHTQLLLSFRPGRKVVLMHKWDPEVAIDLIEKERINFFTGVPTMSQELIQSPSWKTRDVSSLKNVTSGGAARPTDHVRNFSEKAKGKTPGQGYGLTETNALGCLITGEDYLQRPNSVGKPSAPMVTVKIIDENGKTLPNKQKGEVCIRSASLIKEYWNKLEATQEAFKDGWFRTGDIGYLDDEGYVFLVDRAKDIIIRGGENIACTEVEEALYEHEAVCEVAVFAVPDERLGETVAAMVYLNEGTQANADELKAFAQERIAKFKVPEYVWFTDEKLQRGATGKILRREIRDAAVKQYL